MPAPIIFFLDSLTECRKHLKIRIFEAVPKDESSPPFLDKDVNCCYFSPDSFDFGEMFLHPVPRQYAAL